MVAGIGLHFPDVPGTDETHYAKELAGRWNIPWFPAAILASETTSDPIDSLKLHDGPVFPGVQFFDRMFSIAQAIDVDVLLTGQGADAWQTQHYREMQFSALRGDWEAARAWGKYYYRGSRKRAAKRAVKTMLSIAARRKESQYFEERVREYGFRTAFELEERLGQYHGFRVEAPFADRELAAIFVGLLPRLRSTGRGEKMPIRAAMTDRLPESILKRMDKSFFDPVFVAGFGPPKESWNIGRVVAEYYLESWLIHLQTSEN